MPHFYQGELIHTSRRFDERLTVALLAMRERFRPPRMRPTHPAAGFGAEEFGPLLERVERGPETWVEEMRQEYERLHEEYGDFDEDDEDGEEAGENL